MKVSRAWWVVALALTVLCGCSDDETEPVQLTTTTGGTGGTGATGGSGAGGANGGSGGSALAGAPLVVHPDNPRYFAAVDGRAVHLAGHQIFADLQDNAFNKSSTYDFAAELDWDWYLDFATARHLNLVRNWTIWSTGSGSAAPPDRIAHPMMYERTGPGTAVDGLPKFDLTAFHQPFFDRLRERVELAGARGITVAIMLFEVYGFGPGEDEGGQTLWHGNVFRGENNIQGIDVNQNQDDWGMEFFYTDDPTVRSMQTAFVQKVIDTVGDLDNVIYEIANELYATDWQVDMVQHIHDYEADRPKQHLVYMSPGGRNSSGGWTAHDKSELVQSGADCIGIAGNMGDYENDPPVDDSAMPAFWDNDHVWGDNWEHHRRAWMAFTRGYHFILYDLPFENPAEESEVYERMRHNIGATVTYGERFADLARMEPHGELTSTSFCLADPGSEYLIYQPVSGGFTVDLDGGEYDFEWFDPVSYTVGDTGTISSGGGGESFDPPAVFSADAVLYLRSTSR